MIITYMRWPVLHWAMGAVATRSKADDPVITALPNELREL
jgi:hypothetical protein